MEPALAVTTDHPIAAAAGLLAMICYASWPCGSRSAILATYIGYNLAFMLHYALIGQWTAVAINGVLALQTVVAMHLVTRRRLEWLYYGLMLGLALASWITWQGAPSLRAGAAATLSALGRMQTNDASLRLWLLAAAPFWRLHDVIVGSRPGQVTDILRMTSGVVMIAKRSPAIRSLVTRALPGARLAGASRCCREVRFQCCPPVFRP